MASKPGDWYCPACGDLQFARNSTCRKCGTPNPDPMKSAQEMQAGMATGMGGPTQKPGDWYCPGCNDLQFARNTHCRRCGMANPNGSGGKGGAGYGGGYDDYGKGKGGYGPAE